MDAIGHTYVAYGRTLRAVSPRPYAADGRRRSIPTASIDGVSAGRGGSWRDLACLGCSGTVTLRLAWGKGSTVGLLYCTAVGWPWGHRSLYVVTAVGTPEVSPGLGVACLTMLSRQGFVEPKPQRTGPRWRWACSSVVIYFECSKTLVSAWGAFDRRLGAALRH